MLKRLFWMIAVLACIAILTTIVFVPKVDLPIMPPEPVTGEHPPKAQHETRQLGKSEPMLPPVQGSGEDAGPEHNNRPQSHARSSTREESNNAASGTAQTSLPPLMRAVAVEQQGSVPDQKPETNAEVLLYPEFAQRNASNKFAAAMKKLANAKTERDRFHALGRGARLAFVFGKIEHARSYATELLVLDQKFQHEFWRNGDGIFDAHLVLGRIAVKENKIEQAKQHLLSAGTTSGSPVLGSFGPNMTLANDLLLKEERDTVLEYFEQCGKFWTMGKKDLALWTTEVKAGKIPNFGAALYE